VASLRPFIASAGIVHTSPSIWSRRMNLSGRDRTLRFRVTPGTMAKFCLQETVTP
jgi:hypothetical protein